jgi:hypothetical protein
MVFLRRADLFIRTSIAISSLLHQQIPVAPVIPYDKRDLLAGY